MPDDIETTSSEQRGYVARAIRDPAFLVAAVVLLIAAISLQGAVNMLRLHFKKEPVELRQPLASLGSEIGDWVQVTEDAPLSDEMVQNLQTEKYLFRDYINAHLCQMTKADLRAELERPGMTSKDREKVRDRISRAFPKALMSVSLTYYTGKADTVAHIPERCYLADGFNQSSATNERWTTDVRYVTFESQRGESKARICNVAYFFQVNGQYTPSSDVVRMELQDLRHKYAYYAKVELRSGVIDRLEAAEQMKGFLKESWASIETLLPDWSQYRTR